MIDLKPAILILAAFGWAGVFSLHPWRFVGRGRRLFWFLLMQFFASTFGWMAASLILFR